MLDINEIIDDIIKSETDQMRSYIKAIIADTIGIQYDQYNKVTISDELRDHISQQESVIKFKEKLITRIEKGVIDALINKKLLDGAIESIVRSILSNIRNDLTKTIYNKIKPDLNDQILDLVNQKLCEYAEIREHLIAKKL